ncbi:MAG TPA: hypothetical protein VM529_25405 [Gemmata sp.]|nr:hypothetical protein [Gemmata sp.]
MKLLGGACLGLLLFASVAASTDPATPHQPVQPVTPPAPPPGETLPDWPAAPVVPQPMPPQPTPQAVASLGVDELYVVQSDDDVQLLTSPPGVVVVTKEQGPLKIRGLFVGNKIVSTRTYAKKNVFIVERIAPGDVELLLVPAGKVERRVVGDGDGPIPPPKPKPDDPPAPKPPEPATSFRVIFVYESGDTLTAAQHSVIFGKSVSDYLDATATKEAGRPGWRRFDKDAAAEKEQPTMRALWSAVRPQLTATPCLVVEVNGRAEIVPLPATPAEALATLKTYSGGK